MALGPGAEGFQTSVSHGLAEAVRAFVCNVIFVLAFHIVSSKELHSRRIKRQEQI